MDNQKRLKESSSEQTTTREMRFKHERDTLLNILNQMNLVLCLINRNHEIVYYNQRFQDLFGIPDNRKCHEIFKNLQKDCESCNLNTDIDYLTKKLEEIETTSQKIYEVSEIPYKNLKGDFFKLKILYDITEIRQKEKSLKETNIELNNTIQKIQQLSAKLEFQSVLINNINEAVIASNEEHEIQFWNKAAENLYGWKKKEVLGKKVHDLLKTKYFNESRSNIIEIIKNEGRWTGNVIQKHKDGDKIDIFSSVRRFNNPVNHEVIYIIINRDIRDIISAKNKINEMTQFPLGNPNPVLGVDKEKIVYINPSAIKLLKRNKGEPIPIILKELIETTYDKKEVITEEIEIGKEFYAFVSILVEEFNSINLYGMNITKMKRAEKELKHSITIIGHKLQTPLTVFQLGIHNLKNIGHQMTSELRTELFSDLQNNIDELTNLIKKLLDNARNSINGFSNNYFNPNT